MFPLVSVIVPNYNHKGFLKQRLESVFNQTFQNFEVILLDDCSTDDSLKVLEGYIRHPKVSHFVVNKENSGSPFNQWKKGVELAKGSYIWIAESDDYSDVYFLEKMLKLFRENQKVGVAYCQTIDVNEQGDVLLNRIDYTNKFAPNIWRGNFVINGKEFIKKYLVMFNTIPNASAVVFKKELIESNTINESLVNMKMCGDWLFWTKLSLKTDIGFISKELNCFRNHKMASRIHNTSARKKLRLIEEKQVRSFMQKSKMHSKIHERMYYNSWFHFFDYQAVFSRSFYRAKLSKTTIFMFLYYFINYYRKYRWL